MSKYLDIIRLKNQLPDRMQLIQSMQYNGIDHQYDCHHCFDVLLSDTIGDYQIIRKFDIEVDVNMNWDYDLVEGMPDNEKQRFLDNNDDIKYEELYEEYDPYENMYQFEIGEYMQIWFNVKDHSIYTIGRINKDPQYCNLKGNWTGLTDHITKRKAKFLERFNGSKAPCGFFKDETIHEDLIRAGYEPIDAFNWEYNCGEKEYQTAESVFVQDHPLVDFYEEFLSGKQSLTTLLIKTYGRDNFFYVANQKDEQYQKELIAALRICHRNKYTPADAQQWRDMVDMLYKMNKDLHNAHYVCPSDLTKAHNKTVIDYNRHLQRLQRIREKENLKKQIENAKNELEAFIAHMQAFLNLEFKNDNLVIHPLRSPIEYIEEGAAMHHCVGSYRNRYDSLILSARDNEDNRIATIEISLKDYRIIQIRGLQNKPTEHDQEIAVLLTANMNKIRRANNKQKKINAALAA